MFIVHTLRKKNGSSIKMLHQSKWRFLFLYLILNYRYLHADSSKYLHLNNTYIKILRLGMFCAIVRAF